MKKPKKLTLKKIKLEEAIAETPKTNVIEPMGEVSFGREDLNQLGTKVNEIIKYLNDNTIR